MLKCNGNFPGVLMLVLYRWIRARQTYLAGAAVAAGFVAALIAYAQVTGQGAPPA